MEIPERKLKYKQTNKQTNAGESGSKNEKEAEKN